MRRHRFFLGFLALLPILMITACAQTSGPAIDETPPLPADFRQMIIERIKREFFDPYTIRDAAISQAINGTSMMGPTASVCVKANARNRLGAYTGQKETLFVFRRGQITLVDSEFAGPACTSAQYAPFPEIQENYRAPPTGGRESPSR